MLNGTRVPTLLIAAAFALPARAAEDDAEKSRAAFQQIYKVLQHPRCRNCHPDGDRPLYGDPPIPHRMNVQRRLTEVGMACATCHQTKNTNGVHKPPGAPHWGLAPKEQIFEGKTAKALCEALKAPETNGNRTLAQIAAHLTEDPLVQWAWAPGDGREAVPLSRPDFAQVIRVWIDNGAHCPEDQR